LRALARGLVSEGEVDDLVQESWLAALSTRSRPRRSLRAWFTGCAQRRARRAGDGAASSAVGRARRRAARGAESLAQAELQERLIAAVRALREPLSRDGAAAYFEELPLRRSAGGWRTELDRAHALAARLAELRERFEPSRAAPRGRSSSRSRAAGRWRFRLW